MRPTGGANRGAPPVWKRWLRRIASITRLFLVIAVVSAGLLVLQTTRAVQAMREEQSSIRSMERWESLASQLPHGSPEDAQVGVLQALPDETEIAEMLIELRRILEAAGIEKYRSMLVQSQGAGFSSDQEDETGFRGGQHRPLIADEASGGERTLSILDWSEPLEVPEELEEWRMALELQADFARLLSFMLGLDDASGIWSVPRARIRPAGDGVEAEMVLRTFARSLDGAAGRGGRLTSAGEGADPSGAQANGDHPDAGADAGAPPSDPAILAESRLASHAAGPCSEGPEDSKSASRRPGVSIKAGASLRDPFRPSGPGSRTAGTGGRESVPVPPVPGAIRWGLDPSVWIDGRAVRPGEMIRDWLLVEVLEDAVLMRHRSGHTARVKAGS